MADADAEVEARTKWLLEPPGAGEMRVRVDLGEGVELTPEIQAALERLATELNSEEVSGYAQNEGAVRVGVHAEAWPPICIGYVWNPW